MSILKTRYERATDVTYEVEAGQTVVGGRLVRLSSEGASKTKPRVAHTGAATDYAVGAAAFDGIAGDDVGVTHRGWQLLTAAEAIRFGVDVFPAANGRIQDIIGDAGDPMPAGARAYGKALNSAAAAGDLVWVKVFGASG